MTNIALIKMDNGNGNICEAKENYCLNEFSVTVHKAIENIIKVEGYSNYTLKKESLSNDGHFLGTLYAVDVCGTTDDGEKTTSLMVKQSVILEKIKMVEVSDFYVRELFVYEDLSKEFRRLQEDAKVPEEEMFFVLKSYESSKEAIVMENLTKKGYKTYDRTRVIPIKFAELSIAQLAKFHALSFVVKETNPEYFNSKIKTIKTLHNLSSDWIGLVNNICSTTASVLEGRAKAKIKQYAPRIVDFFKKFIIDSDSPYCCLVHGDYKFQNILVKEDNGEAVKVCPIDYQLIYYGNPVDDFLFFIFSGTDQEFRRQHMNDLKKLYVETFAKFLRYFGMEAESIYPRAAFERDYSERFELGLVFGLYVSVFTFSHIDKGFDVRKLSLSELPLLPDDMFEARVRGIVDDYTEWGYL